MVNRPTSAARPSSGLRSSFVEQGLNRLAPAGMLGAITSRTGFFLSSFKKWREEILLKEAEPTVFADLGYGDGRNGGLLSAKMEGGADHRNSSRGVGMTQVTIPEARQRLPELLAAVEAGETVTIPKADGRSFLLSVEVPAAGVNPAWAGYPHAGSAKGLIEIQDDFDDLLEELEGKRRTNPGDPVMSTITLEEAQTSLADVVHRLVPGDVVTIIEHDRPVAQLVPFPAVEPRPPRPRPPVTGVPKIGQYEGRLVVPDDFDEPLEELREYME